MMLLIFIDNWFCRVYRLLMGLFSVNGREFGQELIQLGLQGINNLLLDLNLLFVKGNSGLENHSYCILSSLKLFLSSCDFFLKLGDLSLMSFNLGLDFLCTGTGGFQSLALSSNLVVNLLLVECILGQDNVLIVHCIELVNGSLVSGLGSEDGVNLVKNLLVISLSFFALSFCRSDVTFVFWHPVIVIFVKIFLAPEVI